MAHFRLFLIGTWLAASACLALAVPAPGNAAEKTLRIGSATLGSAGYIHWEACAFLTNKYSKVKASSISTSGSTESVFLLERKAIDIGHGSSLEVVNANEGLPPFKKKYPIWQVFAWNEAALPLITKADRKDINSYADLVGKRVCLAKKGAGAESLLAVVLKALGIYNKMNRVYLGFSDAYSALVDGLIDATIGNYMEGKPVPAMMDLAARCKYKLVNFTSADLAKVQAKSKVVKGVMLPKSAYEGLTRDTLCPGFPLMGISSPNVPDDIIYALVKSVLEHTDELHSISAVSGGVTLAKAVDNLVSGYPVHPGAVRYFKEKGVWKDTLIEGKR